MVEAGPVVVHWFLEQRCNLDCLYCFGPTSSEKPVGENDLLLAQTLVESGVRGVVLGGGEPMLANTLDSVVKILKEGGVYVSLHTNGTLLTRGSLQRLRGLVDDIALPIDAAKRETQERLRGQGFMGVFDGMRELVDWINESGIGVGYHTVFTRHNWRQIPQIYRMINQQPFKYWRIYEYNPDLPRRKFLQINDGTRVTEEKLARWKGIDSLSDDGTISTGQTDSLFARLLLMEKKFQDKYQDPRVQFVFRADSNGYFFLTGSGEVTTYGPNSLDKRPTIGNLLEADLPQLRARRQKALEEEELDGGIAERGWELPYFAREWEGNYWIEEDEEVKWGRYRKRIKHLRQLWLARTGELVSEDE